MKKNKVEWFKPALFTLQSYFVCIFTAGYTFPNLIALFLLKQLIIRFTCRFKATKCFIKQNKCLPHPWFLLSTVPSLILGSSSNRARVALGWRVCENLLSRRDLVLLAVLRTAKWLPLFLKCSSCTCLQPQRCRSTVVVLLGLMVRDPATERASLASRRVKTRDTLSPAVYIFVGPGSSGEGFTDLECFAAFLFPLVLQHRRACWQSTASIPSPRSANGLSVLCQRQMEATSSTALSDLG